jgi:L-ascorbate metabolism protein UlaG (beta-lactamase superfamily)
MNIKYLGHACFKIETKTEVPNKKSEKLTILIDPFDPETGIQLPKIKTDLSLVTHAHHDHSYLDKVESDFLINKPGEYSYKGVNIQGIETYHDSEKGEKRGFNTVYVIEAEKMKIAHLGDLGHVPTEDQIEKMGVVDVLMIPVGGKYTISAKEAKEVIRLIEPTFIIPMHFATDKIKVEGLEPVDNFYKEINKTPMEKVETFKVSNKDLNTEEVKVVAFEE